MSDKHQQSRKGLTINSALFLGASALLLVNFIGNLAESSSAWERITTFASLGIGVGFGVPSILQAWKSFSNLEYGRTMTKGITSWAVPASMVLLDVIF
ncbi:MAG: hypothetical protein OHK0045_17350 [Raineya sp.]